MSDLKGLEEKVVENSKAIDRVLIKLDLLTSLLTPDPKPSK